MSKRKTKASGLAEKIQNRTEFDTSDWIRKERMLGERFKQRVPVGLGIFDDTRAFF